MAIVKFGAPVTGFRGTIGGITFTANASGNLAKPWRMPTYKASTPVSNVRAGLSRYGPTWRTLTSGQRTAWNTWAANPAQERFNSLGVSYFMTGFQAYCSINQCRLTVGLAITPTAPTVAAPSICTGVLFYMYKTGGSAPSAVNFTAGMSTNIYLLFFIALVNSTGQLNRAPSWRFVDFALNSGGGHAIQTELETAFGTIRVGQRGMLAIYRQTPEGYRGAPAYAQDNVRL